MTDQFARRFTALNGGAKDLYDVKRHVELRRQYAPLGTIAWFIGTLDGGRYASGVYPKYWICADGETLSYDACRANAGLIARAIRGDKNRADIDPARFCSSERQWRVIGYAVNWEDPELYCSHTGV